MRVYLGATDEAQEGVWEWVSGESWNPEIPARLDNVNNVEHHLVTRNDGGSGMHLNDAPGEKARFYLIELKQNAIK